MKPTTTIIASLLLLFAPCTLTSAQAQDIYIGSFYITTPEEAATMGDGGDTWAKRRTVICDLFKYEQPDVLGVQGYSSIQLSGMKTGLAYNLAGDIFYKKTLELDSLNTVDGMPEGCTCTWARLKKDGQAFYVFNFCFNSENAYAAANRVRVATGEINTESLPCFATGYLALDENSTAYSRMLARYSDSYTKAEAVSAEFGTVNNFDLAANHGTSRRDFVLVPRNAKVKAYGQLQSAYFTTESDGSHKRRQLSAHFPVMAKVALP